MFNVRLQFTVTVALQGGSMIQFVVKVELQSGSLVQFVTKVELQGGNNGGGGLVELVLLVLFVGN